MYVIGVLLLSSMTSSMRLPQKTDMVYRCTLCSKANHVNNDPCSTFLAAFPISAPLSAGAASRYPASYASYIAVTGCLLSVPAFLYSTRLHASRPWPYRPPANLVPVLNAFLLASFTPVAVRHDSHLIGFFAAAALFGTVGFSAVPYGLSWQVRRSPRCVGHHPALRARPLTAALYPSSSLAVAPGQIGFENEDSMSRSAITSGIVLSLLISLRVRWNAALF